MVQFRNLFNNAVAVRIYSKIEDRIDQRVIEILSKRQFPIKYVIGGIKIQGTSFTGNIKVWLLPGQDIPSLGEVAMFFHAVSVLNTAISSCSISVKNNFAKKNRLGYVLHIIFKTYSALNREVPTGVNGSPLGSIPNYISPYLMFDSEAAQFQVV